MKLINPFLTILLLASLLGVLPVNSYGLKKDRQQKMTMDQDSIEYDTESNNIILKGNVILDQGTIHLEAQNKVIIKKNEQNDLTGFSAYGSPSIYEELLDKDQGKIHAEGNTIHYNAIQGKLELIGDAKLVQGGSTFIGDQLTYDLNEKVILGESPKEGGRVQVTFTPNKSSAEQ